MSRASRIQALSRPRPGDWLAFRIWIVALGILLVSLVSCEQPRHSARDDFEALSRELRHAWCSDPRGTLPDGTCHERRSDP